MMNGCENSSWRKLAQGQSIGSMYTWVAALFLFLDAGGIADLARRIASAKELAELLTPILIGVVMLLLLAVNRVIFVYRLLGRHASIDTAEEQVAQRLAFEAFRLYFFFSVMVLVFCESLIAVIARI